MGSVYKVKNRRLDSVLAVKILNEELATSAEAMKRFNQECEAASKLTHPNLVSILGHGVSTRGAPYMLMQFVDGESLADRLAREVYLNGGQALHVFVQIAEALVYAHGKGVIHRDLKPANIMLERSAFGTAKLVDFGIAKVLESNNRLTQDLTQAGDVLGTPLYMSPEQCLGFQLDARSDIYSFGALMCETLTGRPPFTGDNPMQVIARHLNEAPVDISDRLSRMDVPQPFQDVVLACLRKNPQERYATTGALLADLRALEEGRRPAVSTGKLSSSLRSPLAGLILELLPFTFPTLAYAINMAFTHSSDRRVVSLATWAACIALLFSGFYLAKLSYLRGVTSMVDRQTNHFKRKVSVFYAIVLASLAFGLSQIVMYADFLSQKEALAIKGVKYAPPTALVTFWLLLVCLPFAVALLRSKDRS